MSVVDVVDAAPTVHTGSTVSTAADHTPVPSPMVNIATVHSLRHLLGGSRLPTRTRIQELHDLAQLDLPAAWRALVQFAHACAPNGCGRLGALYFADTMLRSPSNHSIDPSHVIRMFSWAWAWDVEHRAHLSRLAECWRTNSVVPLWASIFVHALMHADNPLPMPLEVPDM
jgi:hypothetical protein